MANFIGEFCPRHFEQTLEHLVEFIGLDVVGDVDAGVMVDEGEVLPVGELVLVS